MPDESESRRPPDLELEVGVGVPVELRQLVNASSTFAAFINEVAESYTGIPRPLKWVVEVKEGSVRLPLRGEPIRSNLSPSVTHDISELITLGLAQLTEKAVRPDHYSDKALEQLRQLARISSDDFPIGVRNGRERHTLSAQLAVNAEKILGGTRQSFGTVEGRLEAVNVHDKNEFGIWLASGAHITCRFGRYVTLDEVLAAVGKRVAARGTIRAKVTGEKQSIEVETLKVLGATPVAADDVRGIFNGRETTDDDW
ncbi:MAG: hypothetical protein ABSC56_06600 [Solirubrobacteraceae bacterium]|jgi:hypothetical protein